MITLATFAMAKCASRAPTGRKRKLPPSFFGRVEPSEQQRASAAVKIQRFLRRCRSIASCVDPIAQEAIPYREAVMLAEAGGVEQWHSASSLVAFFLVTANFCNPLSRRQLRCWEVAKIIQKQPRRLRPLLAATYTARLALQKYRIETEGSDLASTTEESLDETLHRILADVEGFSFDYRPRGLTYALSQYEDGLQDLALLSRDRARKLCLRHREVVKNRGFFCPPPVAADLEKLQDELVLRHAAQAAEPHAVPILKEYLLQRLEFK
jgi:hypothetical protein